MQEQPQISLDEAFKNIAMACAEFNGKKQAHVILDLSLKKVLDLINEKKSEKKDEAIKPD